MLHLLKYLNDKKHTLQDGPGGQKKVKARVCRNVDGLDTHLFEKALQVRRAFLADQAYRDGGAAP